MPAFTDFQLFDLLVGKEMDCVSSNVQAVQWDAAMRNFIVGFGKPTDAQLSFYTYLDVPQEMVEEFAREPSQGKWVSAKLVKTKWPFIPGIQGVKKVFRQSEAAK